MMIESVSPTTEDSRVDSGVGCGNRRALSWITNKRDDVVSFESDGGYSWLRERPDERSAAVRFGRSEIGVLRSSECCQSERAPPRDCAENLAALEEEIRRRGYQSIVLETGRDQPEALALYKAEGYFPIPAFLGYVGNPISRCYAKKC